MKVTIIERQDFEGGQLKQSVERVCYPKDMDELLYTPEGFRAKRIRLECEFDEKDIPKLIAFLQNSQPCFVGQVANKTNETSNQYSPKAPIL